MTDHSRVVLGRSTVVVGGIVLLAVGGVGGYTLTRPWSPGTPSAAQSGTRPASPPQPGSPQTGRLPDVVVPITREAQQRVGIVVGSLSAQRVAAARRLPAMIQPDAYKRVSVTPLVAGRVTRVVAALGQEVARGAVLAEIFSPELSETESRYVSLTAELDAHDRELRRTEQLVEIGAASRQELDMLHAEHAGKVAEVESARSKLTLLGLSADTIARLAPGTAVNPTAAVHAPVTGTIIERTANPGLNVEAASPLFTIADLSTVWIVADVYEQDFALVRPGLPARVTLPALPAFAFDGTVSYIDPQVDPQSRTAKLRIEVPNPHGELRLGMIANVELRTTGTATSLVVPRSAVQYVGDRTVVYLARPAEPGAFIEREVRLGAAVNEDELVVLDGVATGDSVVTEGSFAVRAERERLGLGSPSRSGNVTAR